MGDRRRQRSPSMIKMANQKRESRLWYEEANSHTKAGNLPISIHSYNKISRETELLQSFIRINIHDYDKHEEEDTNDSAEEDQSKKDEAAELAEPAKTAKSAEVAENEKAEDSNGRQTPISPETSRKLSEQLSQEVKKKIKKKKKKLGLKQQEIYCDKDRAAAVSLGSKDIKQSLRLKRKQDRSKFLQIPEEAEPSTFLALGNYEMCRGDLHIATDFISKALELNPMEKNALVARSKCYILLGQPENALKDAEAALQIDKHFLKAIYQKAEALYYLGDFEHSLMYYHRGLHIRPDHEGFKLGVHKAQKAIENAIGSSFSQLIRSRTASSNNASEKSAVSVGSSVENRTERTPTPKTSNRTTPSGMVKRSSKKSRLLRELGTDKEYLDNLLHNPNIKCKYKENDSTVEKCIQDTVEYLNARQEFWRQQLPQHLK